MPGRSTRYRGAGGNVAAVVQIVQDFTADVALSVDSLDVLADLTADTALAVDALDLLADLSAGTALSVDSLDVLVDLTADVALSGGYAVVDMLPQEDTYLRRDQGNTVFGAAVSSQAKQNTAVVNDDRNAYIAWDLTGFAGTVTQNGSFHIRALHNGVGAQPLTYELWHDVTKPLEEDTATWNNSEPPAGTQVHSATVSVPAGAATDHVVTVDAADLNVSVGEWFWVRLRGNQSLGGDLVLFTTSTKESPTAAARPVLNFTVDV